MTTEGTGNQGRHPRCDQQEAWDGSHKEAAGKIKAAGYGIMPVREAALFAERRGMWNTTQHTAPGERTLVGLFGVPVPGPWPLLESLPWAVSLYLRRSALATPCWVRDS